MSDGIVDPIFYICDVDVICVVPDRKSAREILSDSLQQLQFAGSRESNDAEPANDDDARRKRHYDIHVLYA